MDDYAVFLTASNNLTISQLAINKGIKPQVSFKEESGSSKIYTVEFYEGETLHYTAPDVTGEQTVAYSSDNNGVKDITVSENGDLVCWTTFGGTEVANESTRITTSISVTSDEVIVDLGESGSTATMTIENNEATLTEVTLSTTASTITVSGTVGTNNVPVTSIADGVFTAENTANVQSIDLSSTQVALTGDVRSSGVLSAIPENVIIVLPQESSSATGANVVTTNDGTNFTCSEVKIAEDKAFVNGVTDFTTTKFTFDRTFLNGDGQYNTVFLPVDIPAAVKTTLGTFYTCTSVNESGAVLTEVDGDLSANTAYIFKPASGKNKIEYTGDTELTVKVNANITNPTGAGLKGTNVEGTIATLATDATKAYGYAAETTDGATVGAFYKLKSTATVPAYRAWLEITGEAPSRLAIIIDGDDTTGIQSIDGIPVNEGVWYDIMGRKYTSKPTQKGVYILNGKKIYVK